MLSYGAKLLSYVYLGKRGIAHIRGSQRIITEIKSKFYKYVWKSAAEKIGGSIEEIGSGIYEIRYKNLCTKVLENYTELDDIISMTIAGNKTLVLSLLSNNGIATPRYRQFGIDELKAAQQFIHSLNQNCVIKPANSTAGGSGVSAEVAHKWDLFKSASRASSFGGKLLVEEQLDGDNYRLLYLNGIFIDAVRRYPPRIKGDGKSSIKTLVQRENKSRIVNGWERAHTVITIDGDMKNCLRKHDLSLHSVLEDGNTIKVKTVISENNCYENERIFDICKSIIDDGARAVNLIGAKVAGVDIITNNPAIPLKESHGAVIEVNTTPSYYYHYKNSTGPFEVADFVLKAIFQN